MNNNNPQIIPTDIIQDRNLGYTFKLCIPSFLNITTVANVKIYISSKYIQDIEHKDCGELVLKSGINNY